MSITDRIREREAARCALTDFEAETLQKRAELVRDLKQKTDAAAVEAMGLDSDRIDRARQVIQIRGSYTTGGSDRESAKADAVKCLATEGGQRLRSEYFGTKDYDRWHGQRSDHPYGMCPRHGHIIFAIGLHIRDRELSPEELEDALYYLENLEAVEKAQAAGVQVKAGAE